MGTNECSQPASKSSWDSQDFGDVNMVLKMVHFHKSSRPQWVKWISSKKWFVWTQLPHWILFWRLQLTICYHWVTQWDREKNGRHFPDDIFKCIFMNEKFCILIDISLKFVSKVRINNTPALDQIMAWRRTGDKPLPEPNADTVHWHLYAALRVKWVKAMAWHRTGFKALPFEQCLPKTKMT